MRLLILALLLSGCNTITLRPRQRDHVQRLLEVQGRLGVDSLRLNSMLADTQEQCNALDTKVTALTATSISLGIAGGGSGVATLFAPTTSRYITGGISLGVAMVTAGTSYASTHEAQRYARECAVNVGGQ